MSPLEPELDYYLMLIYPIVPRLETVSYIMGRIYGTICWSIWGTSLSLLNLSTLFNVILMYFFSIGIYRFVQLIYTAGVCASFLCLNDEQLSVCTGPKGRPGQCRELGTAPVRPRLLYCHSTICDRREVSYYCLCHYFANSFPSCLNKRIEKNVSFIRYNDESRINLIWGFEVFQCRQLWCFVMQKPCKNMSRRWIFNLCIYNRCLPKIQVHICNSSGPKELLYESEQSG